MKIKKILVQFSNPSKEYYSGGEIDGSILVKLKTPALVEGIRLHIGGQCVVRPFVRHGTTRAAERRILYLANVNCLSINLELLSPGQQLEEGENLIPFSATLPSSIPSSFEGCQGYIRYSVEVTVSLNGEPSANESQNFTVIHHLDLNKIPESKLSIDAEDSEYIHGLCCQRVGEYKAKLFINKTGYVPRESLNFTINIQNDSPLRSRWIRLFFRQIVTYTGFRDGKMSDASQKEVKTKKILLYEQNGLISRKLHLNECAAVPSLPVSHLPGCNIIDILYNIVLQIDLQSEVMEIIRNIIIGTKPLKTTDVCSQDINVSLPPTYSECVEPVNQSTYHCYGAV